MTTRALARCSPLSGPRVAPEKPPLRGLAPDASLGAPRGSARADDPASGWTLRQATAINNGGQIVGAGDFQHPTDPTRSFRSHGFLLTPIKPPSQVVSIPHIVQWILFGVRLDQPGVAVPAGGGPTPVPPWGPDRASVPPEMGDLWSAYATYVSAERISSARERREIQRTALELMRAELTRVLGAWIEITRA